MYFSKNRPTTPQLARHERIVSRLDLLSVFLRPDQDIVADVSELLIWDIDGIVDVTSRLDQQAEDAEGQPQRVAGCEPDGR